MTQNDDFPRGGYNKRKRRGQQETDGFVTAKSNTLFDEETKTDFFGNDNVRLTNRAKRKMKPGGITYKNSAYNEEDTNANDKFYNIEPLSAQCLSVDMLILGCIQKIKTYEMIVSLPNGLRGSVAVTNISDAYTGRLRKYVDDHSVEDGDYEEGKALSLLDMFSVGSYVVCKVKSLFTPRSYENNIKISLSMNPRDVNEELTESMLYNQMVLPAAVSSVEDHGFVMDIGFPDGPTAFLKRNNAHKYEMSVNKGQPLQVGQVIFCAIHMPKADFNKDRIRVVELTASLKQLVRSMVDNETVNPRSLIPGSLIRATISSIKPRGLCLDGCTYKALVYKDHQNKRATTATDGGYEINQEVTGRVLYIHPVAKVPYVSLLPELRALFPGKGFGGFRVWELVTSAKVTRIMKTQVEFDLNGVRGLAPRVYVPDMDRVTEGSVHSCRILGLSYMECCAIVSLKPCHLEKVFLFIEDVKPGDKVQCEVVSVNADKVQVSVENLFGVIPAFHLDDGLVADADFRFPAGRILTCRVLNVHLGQNRLTLTHKKSLVTSKRPILASYSDAKPELVADGTIVSITDTGLIIRFYENVKGFIHMSNVVSGGRSVILNKAFKRGQTVSCKVLSCDLDASVLRLSLDVGDEGGIGLSFPAKGEFPVGKLVSCRVSVVSDDGLFIEVFPSGLQAFLPKQHLSDHPSNCSSLLRTYKVGDVVNEVLCFSTGVPPIATLKPTFIDWVKSGQAFEEFSQLKAGLRIPAAVRNYSEHGLFVNLLYNFKALVPSHVLDCHGLEDVYERHQTLIGTVRNLHPNQNKVAISVAPVDVEIEDDCTAIVFLQNYIAEQDKIRRFAAKSGQVGAVALSSLTVGLLVDFVVGAVSPHGVVGRANNVRALVTNQHLPDAIVSLDVGLSLRAVVLGVDFVEECVELSLRSSFVDASTTSSLDSLVVGDTVDAVCALIKEDYSLAALQVQGGILYGYMPTKTHPNEVFDVEKLPVVGTTFKVNVNRFIERTPIVIQASHASSRAIWGNNLFSVWSSSQQRTHSATRWSNHGPSVMSSYEKSIDEKIYSSSAPNTATKRSKSKRDIVLGVDLHNYTNLDQLSNIINSYMDVPEEEKFVEVDASDMESSFSDDNKPTLTRRKRDKKIKTKLEPIASSTLRRLRAITQRIDDVEADIDSGFPTMQQEPAKQNTNSEKQNLRRLNVTKGFEWDVENIAAKLKKEVENSSGSSSDDNDDDDSSKTGNVRKVRRNRGVKSKLEEEELYRTENMLVDVDRQPETADDYDRLVLSSPNASLVWLKYMAFHLQSAEFDKARSVAERALKTISFREEQDKLNVWAGLLNLENQYGTKESLTSVFQRALQLNEPIKVYNLLTNIYEQSDNLDAAEKLYEVMVKRFKSELDVWINFCSFLMKHGRLETARKHLEKSLVVLPKLKHVMMITKFVCLEFKYGEQQRGRTMMESVVSNYPRRMDVWGIYVDLVTKCGDIDGARLIYERLLKLKGLVVRKMRAVFKKYLDFEKHHGTENTVAYVTQKAKEFVDTLDAKDFDVRR